MNGFLYDRGRRQERDKVDLIFDFRFELKKWCVNIKENTLPTKYSLKQIYTSGKQIILARRRTATILQIWKMILK